MGSWALNASTECVGYCHCYKDEAVHNLRIAIKLELPVLKGRVLLELFAERGKRYKVNFSSGSSSTQNFVMIDGQKWGQFQNFELLEPINRQESEI